LRLLPVLLLLLATPAFADDWQRYENQLYGYAIDVPPGLLWRGEGGNGDGQDFTTPTVTLHVRAAPSPAGFEASVRDWQDWEGGQGWNIAFQSVTPTRAALSARRPGWLMEMRGIDLCGTAWVKFQLEYGVADVATMGPVIERLASSLARTRPC
jgi:hypothetical protein